MMRNEYLQLAVLGAVLITVALLVTQWSAVRRMRHSVHRDLQRVFEQVDLLRMEKQTESRVMTPLGTQSAGMPEAYTAPLHAPLPAMEAGVGYAAALELAARGASDTEISIRCGLGAAEARILVGMQRMKHPVDP